ncbi:MAG: hypothetical protein DMF67_14980 [Acidobacteria bacterium]|nr:MAG: hypothetical protein DMF67_14980 [Acidobacteriota bacterium]
MPARSPFKKRAPRREPVRPPPASRVLTWAEVNRTHPIHNGVYQRGGRLVSLLTDFGRLNPCYPDEPAPDGETVCYTGEGRRGDQHLSPGNLALLAAIESGHAVPLFNKLGVGRWQHTGLWRVVHAEHRFDERERRMLWRFTLKRVPGSKFQVRSSTHEGGSAKTKAGSFRRKATFERRV